MLRSEVQGRAAIISCSVHRCTLSNVRAQFKPKTLEQTSLHASTPQDVASKTKASLKAKIQPDQTKKQTRKEPQEGHEYKQF
eukprot:2478219-Amphidinium_carterae.1